MNLTQTLQEIPALKAVPVDQLEWLSEKSELIKLQKGDKIFEPGDPIDRLLILTKGGFSIKLKKNNQLISLGQASAPVITGLLPYSRADEAKGYGEVDQDSEIVALEKAHFREMICDCHELTTVLVHEMSSRIRQFTKNEQLDDKMLSLGKLSAGLAHELNNPSAAVVRSSKALSKHLKFLPEKFKKVVRINMSEEKIDQVNGLLFQKITGGIQKMSMMERSNKEDELLDWLYEHEVEEPEDMVENLIDYDFDIGDLEEVIRNTPSEHQPSVLNWMNQVMTTERLVGEIEDASERISDLVTSIKSYTHMDQAPEKIKTDLRIGLDNTLTMLKHKIQDNKVHVVKKYDTAIPHPEILPSAMNQVWTNIIDNAIDAMEQSENRMLTIETRLSGDFIKVGIQDSGSGIPDDIKDKIFDPFFTTKPVGKGTGLGLENVLQIVKLQHHGVVEVDSNPGNTQITISLPLKA